MHRMTLCSVFVTFVFSMSILSLAAADQSPRMQIDFDFDWRFFLGDAKDAHKPDYDDQTWQRLNVPHDWSIEGTPAKGNPSGGRGGYFPCGIGWYRKTFQLGPEYKGKKVFIQFDGVYMSSDVWLNGQHLGHRGYGYIGFEYEVTPYLRVGENILAVRVDNSHQPHDRWYGGGGIYRHVRLMIVKDLYVPQWGTFVATPEITKSSAMVVVKTEIVNDSMRKRRFKLITEIVNAQGHMVRTETTDVTIAPRGCFDARKIEQTHKIQLTNPILWDVDNPYLYIAVTKIVENDQLVDVYTTPFGVHSVEFVPHKGMLLNGKRVVMKGVCIHHDAGCVWAAVPDAENLIRFEVRGPAKIIGVDNGDLTSSESYKASRRQARNGRCLVMIQTETRGGNIELTAYSEGLKKGRVLIEVRKD